MTNALLVAASMVVISAIGCVVADPQGQCPDKGIVSLPHQKSCTKYYMCFDGKPVQQRCAEGLLFDHRQKSCLLQSEAQCTLDVCPADEVGIVQMVPHPENCSKYFACTRGHGLELTCSGELLFNRKTGSCDLPEHVKYCGLDEEPTEAPLMHCPAKGVLKVPHVSECNKYYLCIDGREVTFKCTAELMYDVKTSTCNHPQISRCASAQSHH